MKGAAFAILLATSTAMVAANTPKSHHAAHAHKSGIGLADGRKTVIVHGYTRRNVTYVHGYLRKPPKSNTRALKKKHP